MEEAISKLSVEEAKGEDSETQHSGKEKKIEMSMFLFSNLFS